MGKKDHKKSCTHVADYIVVGMGAAGCLMARKLSDDFDYSVIGIEAGLNNIDTIPITKSIYAGVEYGLPTNYYPEYFYQQKPLNNGSLSNLISPSNRINGSDIPINQTDTTVGDYTTGRILGGGSSINGQQYVRGTSAYWDYVSSITGSSHWNSTNVTNTFIELENYLGMTSNHDIHGYTGDMHIRQAPQPTATSMASKFVLRPPCCS